MEMNQLNLLLKLITGVLWNLIITTLLWNVIMTIESVCSWISVSVWLCVSVFPSWFWVDIFCCLETELPERLAAAKLVSARERHVSLRIHTYDPDPAVCTQLHRTKPALCYCDVWHIEMEDVVWTSSTQTLFQWFPDCISLLPVADAFTYTLTAQI